MTDYQSYEEMVEELSKAVKPYGALVQHELRSADYTEFWWNQEITTPWDYAKAYECGHAKREPVRWTLSNGVERVTLQCVACGDKYSTGVKKADYPNFDELPDLDEDLKEDARDAFNTFFGRLRAIHDNARIEFETRRDKMTELERLAKDRAWWNKYSNYLKTPEWASKRDRVLERDGYVCQACLRRDATIAHHLTYEQVFNEPLFDLIAVCRVCHNAIHPHLNGDNGHV